MNEDRLHRFLFDGTDVRGELVHVEHACRKILAAHNYPAVIENLLSEFVAASVLLGATIKFEGRLVLQARGEGLVSLVMSEVTHDGNVRGIVRHGDLPEDAGADIRSLLSGGTLAVTIERDNGERYQSLVPLVGETLATCLEGYFQQSEQLNTRMMLTGEGGQAAGLLIQQLPPQEVTDAADRERQWEHLVTLGQTVTSDELHSLSPTDLLRRLFAEDRVRLLDSRPLRFDCSCSANRTAQSLLSIGAQELESLFREMPVVTVDCEFCRTVYEFTRESLTEMVRGSEPEH